MLLTKTSSLPQLKVNLNKYDNFFTKKATIKDIALDQPEDEALENEAEATANQRKKAHSKNLEIIDRKSTIKSKVESYLTDSHKMGILDHNVNQTRNRRSLTRISLEAMKPLHTSAEQLKRYLTQLKTQINEYFEKNQRMEHEIKNSEGRTTQVREKIIFYEQLAQKTWIHRYELLDQRHENLQHIRYETDRLVFMQQRLKEINILMRKRVKDAQNALKNAENEAKTTNQLEGIRQDDLDNKVYLLKHYEAFEQGKSEKMGYKTNQAIRNMQENQAAALLRRHHDSISVMQPQDYQEEKIMVEHIKFIREIATHRAYAKMLDATWTRCSTYYEQYQKAQQLMKMHAINRNADVQDSYNRSFEIKKDLEQKIQEREKKVAQLEARNKQLREQCSQSNYGEIEEIQRRINNIRLEYKTGKKLLKDKETIDKHQEERIINNREEEIERAKSMLSRLREWIKDREKIFQLIISKKQPICDHYTLFISEVYKQLKQHEPTFILKPAEPEKKIVIKPNKYGNKKKR